MIPWITLSVGLVSLAVLLILCWMLRRPTEVAEYDVGFRMSETQEEEEYEDGGEA